MTDINQIKELEGDLDFILDRAIDQIDLAIHNAGLSETVGHDQVFRKFGAATAGRWLNYQRTRIAENALATATVQND